MSVINGIIMESIWIKTVKEDELKQKKKTYFSSSAEIVVIGAGMAGVLIAYFLQKEGKEVIVLEADKIGYGQTKGTTAKITSQHNLIYSDLIKRLGAEQAQMYARANEKAIKKYEDIIQEEQIVCHFERCSSYLYSVSKGNAVEKNRLKEEAEAAKQLGIQAEYIDKESNPDKKSEIESELSMPIRSALEFQNQAKFHPLKFLYAIAKDLTIYENTKVMSVEEHKIITEQGEITAEKIVFATHYPFLNVPGYYFARMHQERSYVIALEQVPKLNHMYLGIDKEEAYSFRSDITTDGKPVVLLGGGSHRTGENALGGQYDKLKGKAIQLWPESKVIASWSAQDCITLDKIPYIGTYAASTPDWYVATGFGKWGMSSSMVAAMIITDLIMERENEDADIFSPHRFQISPSVKNIVKEGAQAVKGLLLENFKMPKKEIEDLKAGYGGIVEYEGEKVGIYKNEEGECYIVSVRCPHLGCQLEWNPDELSWDCPCHGSRFTYEGTLIDNPAQEDIRYE